MLWDMSERSVFMRDRRSPLWCGGGRVWPYGLVLWGLALYAAVVCIAGNGGVMIKRETRASGGCLGTERR